MNLINMTSTEILSLVLGIISLIMAGFGTFLFFYFEDIKPERKRKVDFKKFKKSYEELLKYLDCEDSEWDLYFPKTLYPTPMNVINVIDIEIRQISNSKLHGEEQAKLISVYENVKRIFDLWNIQRKHALKIKQNEKIDIEFLKEVWSEVSFALENTPWILEIFYDVELRNTHNNVDWWANNRLKHTIYHDGTTKNFEQLKPAESELPKSSEPKTPEPKPKLNLNLNLTPKIKSTIKKVTTKKNVTPSKKNTTK